MPKLDRPIDNQILAALTAPERERLFPRLERVPMRLGEVLYEAGARIGHAWFPSNCILSLMSILQNGSSTEIALVGNEGMLGVALFMGGEIALSRAVVQSAGFAFRLDAAALNDEFNRAGTLQRLLLRYTQALLTQMAQTAACNRHHAVDQQLCRWLLLMLDRLPTNEVAMTQDLIAKMLGVRREGVTEAAGNLQRAGLIRYLRGRISVLDRPGLEARVCECYSVVKREFDRLLAGFACPDGICAVPRNE